MLFKSLVGSHRFNLVMESSSDIDYVVYCKEADKHTNRIKIKNSADIIKVSYKELFDLKKCASIRHIIAFHAILEGDKELVDFIKNHLRNLLMLSPIDLYNSIMEEYLAALVIHLPHVEFQYLMTSVNLSKGMDISEATYAGDEDRDFYFDLRYGRRSKKDLIKYCSPLLEDEMHNKILNMRPDLEFHRQLCAQIRKAEARLEENSNV